MTNDRRYPEGGQRGRKLDEWRGVGSFGTIGLQIVLCIAVGFFGGRWLDAKFVTAPYLERIGFFFGLAAAINSVMHAHREMQRLAEREEREHGNPLPMYDARDDERKNHERNASIEKNASVAIDNDEAVDDEADDDDDDDEADDNRGKSDR